LRFSGKKIAKTATKTTVVTRIQPVTSAPAIPAAAAAAGGDDARASSMRQVMRTLRDTRQSINDLRQKTENALANLQQANCERRQQFEEIQAAKVFFTAPCNAERGYATVSRPSVHPSIRPSFCLSVTFRYVYHTGWNTSKTISRPNSLRYLLRLTPNIDHLVQCGHPKIRVE